MMDRAREIAKAVFAAAMIAAVVAAMFVLVPRFPAEAQPTVNLPTATVTSGVTNGAVVQIIGYNPGRRAIQICSGNGASNILPVNPAGMTAVTPTTTANGTGIQVAANTCYSSPTLLTNSGTSGGQTAAWNAIAQTATNANISVLEY